MNMECGEEFALKFRKRCETDPFLSGAVKSVRLRVNKCDDEERKLEGHRIETYTDTNKL